MGIIDKIKEKIAEQNKLASKMADNLFTHSRNGNPVIRPMTREDVLGLVKNGVYLRGGANLMAKTYRDTVARHREKEIRGLCWQVLQMQSVSALYILLMLC